MIMSADSTWFHPLCSKVGLTMIRCGQGVIRENFSSAASRNHRRTANRDYIEDKYRNNM